MKTAIDMAREVGLSPVEYPTTEKLERLVALVRADERNRTWTQEHWTDYERSIAAVEREAIISRLLEIGALGDGAFIESIRARGQA